MHRGRVAPMTGLRMSVVVGVASMCVGCGESWQVVEPGDATAFKGEKTFMFDALSLGDAKVDGGTEEEYVAEGDELVEFWNRGRKTLIDRYAVALTERMRERGLSIGPGPTIRAHVEKITVGELYTVDNNPNYLRTEVSLVISVSERGKQSDQVRIVQSAHGFATKPVELRFGAVGDGLGRLTADFVASRTE